MSLLASWYSIPSNSDFSIHNLPFGIFSKGNLARRVGIALGNDVVDLEQLRSFGLLSDVSIPTFEVENLNQLLKTHVKDLRTTRIIVQNLFSDLTSPLNKDRSLLKKILISQSEVFLHRPVAPQNFVDFYSSLEHATNVGTMFRDPTNPLLPNWKHIPIGYNGKASTVIVSGVPVKRPLGQTCALDSESPSFGPTKQLDFELEMGVVLSKTTKLGNPISMSEADDAIFGFVLLNDWTARDVQRWEYVPLGPFLSKSFATSISPWIVTKEALEFAKVKGPLQDKPVLPYLKPLAENRNYDVTLEVSLKTKKQDEPGLICRTNYSTMFWDHRQQLVHLTSNGSNTEAGDLFGSGTISGSTPDSFGSLLELCWKGTKPMLLPSGESRTFLEDFDTVIMKGFVERNGVRVGFGDVTAQILPADSID